MALPQRSFVPHLDAGEDLAWSLHTPDEVRTLLERGAFVQSLMAAPLWRFFVSKYPKTVGF